MSSTEGSDKHQAARQMLVELKGRLSRPLTTADVLMEFADRANRNEPVDWKALVSLLDEFLSHLSDGERAKLVVNLRRSHFMMYVGQVYREQKS